MNIIEQNKFILQMQLTSLMSVQKSELIKSPYKLFTLHDCTFMIEITLIKNDTMWFETYYANVDNIKCQAKKHKVFGKQISYIADEIFMRLSNCDLKHADNICLRKSVRCKVIKKQEVIETEIIRKRSNIRELKEPVVEKRRPCNDSERRQAVLERKLFKDPKMWNFGS